LSGFSAKNITIEPRWALRPPLCAFLFPRYNCAYGVPATSERFPQRNLPFCYLCGRDFIAGDSQNRDHVPPRNIFARADREPLWLPTHTACNSAYRLLDEKIGQLIALRYGKAPRNAGQRRLKFVYSRQRDLGAVVNLDIDAAVWRWIGGFHAALYREASVGIRGSLVTPFPKARIVNGRSVFAPLLVQHPLFVQTIKSNRTRGNLDRVVCNKGKLAYECVWKQADNGGPWMCIFALDIYDWKDLGRTAVLPARGCAGFYVTPSGGIPTYATRATTSSIIIPSSDRLDAFAP
jgi:hypothetical protein